MLPEPFLERLQQLCPSNLKPQVLQSFEQHKQLSFRLNLLKENSDVVLPYLVEAGVDSTAVDWLHEKGIAAYQCPPQQREKLTHSKFAEQGDIYIQSLSSILAPLILQPETDDWVLDLAAAPGGKTILMAEMMANQGKISAVEPVKNRFFRLKANLERMGVMNTRVYMKDGRSVGKLKPDTFDKVLLDAPCSSESRFKTYDEKSYAHWNLRKVAECAKKQKRLILSGFDALKAGGVMLYSTCSFSPEENELVVNHLLKKRPTAELVSFDLPISNTSAGMIEWQRRILHPGCVLTRRIWPTEEMDGFYLALICKH